MLAHAFNPSTQDGQSMSSRPAWSTEFQDSQSYYTERPWLKTNKQTKKEVRGLRARWLSEWKYFSLVAQARQPEVYPWDPYKTQIRWHVSVVTPHSEAFSTASQKHTWQKQHPAPKHSGLRKQLLRAVLWPPQESRTRVHLLTSFHTNRGTNKQ